MHGEGRCWQVAMLGARPVHTIVCSKKQSFNLYNTKTNKLCGSPPTKLNPKVEPYHTIQQKKRKLVDCIGDKQAKESNNRRISVT